MLKSILRSMMTFRRGSVFAILGSLLLAQAASGALLGVPLEFPVLSFIGGNNSVVYDADPTKQTLNVDAAGNLYSFASFGDPNCNSIGFPRCRVEADSNGVDFVQIRVQVDGDGDLIGGQGGDDLQVIGAIDLDGVPGNDVDGVLLTGEVVQMGFTPGGNLLDFRFQVTGGLLADAGDYAGKQIGLTLTAEGTDLSFASSFTALAKGSIGPTTPMPDIALCKQVSLTGGPPFFDADDNAKDRCDDFAANVPVGPLGSEATYRLLVRNTGTEPLVGVIINDMALDLNNVSVPGGALLPGEERVIDSGTAGFDDLFDADRCLDPGLKPNTAVVDAVGETSGDAVSDADDAAVRCVSERIKLLKEVSVDGGVTFFDANDSASAPSTAVGGGALYRITVTNTGTSDLENVVVNDATLGIVDFPVGDLAVNAVRVLTQGDIPELDQPGRCKEPGDVTNIADVAGVSVDSGATVTDSDPAVVKCFKEDIHLLKEVSVDSGMTWFDANDSASAPATAVGGGALYRLTVTNTGTSDLTSVVINDVTLGILNYSVGNLAVNQVVVLTEGEIRALDKPGRCAKPGDVTNVAQVVGESVDTGNEVSDTDPAVVRCVEEEITLLKEVSIDGGVTFFDANDGASAPVAALGGGAIYRITVTNTGTSDLSNVLLDDEELGISDYLVGFIAAGDSVVLTEMEIPVLDQPGLCEERGDFTNIATVNGTSVDTGTNVSASDPAVVRCVEEEIRLLKEVSVDGGNSYFDANDSASAPTTAVGGGALYRFTVTNTGTSVLNNVVVNDADLGIVNHPVGQLLPNQTVVLTSGEIPALEQPGRCEEPGDVTNVADVSGTSVDTGNTVTGTDPAVVKCVEEDIRLLKEVSVDDGATWFDANTPADTPATVVGGGALYRLTVTNSGTSILENVVVNDATLGVSFSVGTLAVGQTVVLTSGEIEELHQPDLCGTPGTVNNIATTTGMSVPTRNTVSDSDPANVRCVEERIKLLKEVSVDGGVTWFDANDAASAPATSVGGGALYRLTVTNTGTSDLTNVVINDVALDVTDFPVGDLGAGDTVVLGQGQIPELEQPGLCQDPGNVTNIATVSGESMDTGNTVSDSDPAVVKCEQLATCAIQVDKTCIVEPPPPSDNLLCESAISATTLRYTGTSIDGATVVFTGDKTGSASYTMDLVSGVTVLTSPAENGFTIDAGDGEGLGSKTTITINGVAEIIHTSCSAIYSAGQPAPLDGNTPNPPDSEKGDPSPNWFVVNFRDKDDAFVEVADPTPPAGAESCVIDPGEASCETLGKPTTLTFRYTGGGCPGNNTQGSKSDCSGSVDGDLAATVTVQTGDGYSVSTSPVIPGELFTVTRGGSDFRSSTIITLSNSGGSQENDVHTSCSAPLQVGDEFGGMTLVSFNGDNGGTAVTYRYLVSNTGNTDVSLSSVFDDKIGELLSSPPQLLAQGDTLELFSSADISEETTNVVDVVGNVNGVPAAECMASDAVTVSIAPPPPQPVSCGDIKDLTSLRLVWDGPNGVDVESEVGQVFTGVNRGDVILLDTPKDQTGNDVDIFLSTSVNGSSRFHISCSDEQMNGNEDCGVAQGDGKGSDSSLVNTWLLDGMTGENGSFTCNIPQATGAVLSGSYPGPGPGGSDVSAAASLDLGDKKKVKWEFTNDGATDVFITRVTISWPSEHGKLKKFKLAGDFAKDVNDTSSPTAVPDDKAFESDANKRRLEAGDTDKLEIEFDDDFKEHSESDFSITVEFDNGQVFTFP